MSNQEHFEWSPSFLGRSRFVMGWWKRIYSRKKFHYQDPTTDELNYWRERIIFAAFASCTGLALFIVVPSVYLAVTKRLWVLLIADTSAFLILVYLLISRSIALRRQAMILVVAAFLIGVIIIGQLGFQSGGSAWLFTFSVLAGLLLGFRAAMTATIINTVAITLLGWIVYHWHPAEQPFLGTLSRSIAAGGNFVFLNAVVAISVAVLINGLQELHRKTAVATAALKEEKAVLLSTRERLTNEIEERKRIALELERARDSAEVANRAKSDFLANMSHELRTPLNHIIGFTELVAYKNLGELNPQQEEYLNDVVKSSHHLLTLVNDILDMSKVEAGKMTLSLSMISLRSLVDDSLTMMREKAMKHRFKVSAEISDPLESIPADETKLKQILYNLLSNAMKFTPDGGTILVRVAPDHESPAGIHGIRFSVIDSGIGLDAGDLERIFKPFEQVDSAINRRYQGTGLGLALTRKMVQLHGGEIWATSDGEGKGSAFHFVLPLLDEMPPEQAGTGMQA